MGKLEHRVLDTLNQGLTNLVAEHAKEFQRRMRDIGDDMLRRFTNAKTFHMLELDKKKVETIGTVQSLCDKLDKLQEKEDKLYEKKTSFKIRRLTNGNSYLDLLSDQEDIKEELHSEQDSDSESEEAGKKRTQQTKTSKLLGEPLNQGKWLNGGTSAQEDEYSESSSSCERESEPRKETTKSGDADHSGGQENELNFRENLVEFGVASMTNLE